MPRSGYVVLEDRYHQVQLEEEDQQVELLDGDDEQVGLEDGSELDEGMRLIQTNPKKSPQDTIMINALKYALSNKKREWSVPDKFTLAFSAIGGVGTVATLIDGIFGESLRLKELVPRGARQWSAFVGTTMAGGYVEAIPGLSMIGGPVMSAVTAVIEKKGAAGVVRSAGKTAVAGAIDSVIGIASGGAYSLAQLGTAWLASAGAVWLKAKFYKDTYRASAALFLKRAAQLNDVFRKNQKGLSMTTSNEVERKLKWLERQAEKCQVRGKVYEIYEQLALKKFDEGLEKIKGKLNMQQDPAKVGLLSAGAADNS